MSLIVKQKVSFYVLIKRYVLNKFSFIIYKLYNRYYNNNIYSYDFKGKRLHNNSLEGAELYVDEGTAIENYKIEINKSDKTKLSQYFPYLKIEEKKQEDLKLRVLNIGCFYAGCDDLFIKRNPECEVFGLDFGDIKKYNSDIKNKNLHLLSGYPLETLELFFDDKSKGKFDYAIFVRTAVKINIEQLLEYMKILEKICDNVLFLEPAKLMSSHKKAIDVDKIDLHNPFKLYRGMYLHNYSKLLEKFNYKIIEKKVISPNQFSQDFTEDHDFVYFHGSKI